LHIGRIYYEPQTDCSGAAPAQAGGMCDIRVLAGRHGVLAGRHAPERAPLCRFFFRAAEALGAAVCSAAWVTRAPRPRAANGPGTIEEVWGEDNSWIRVKWDVTGETGCYWVASLWTCLPHATGGHADGRHGCSPLVSLDPPKPPTPPASEPAGDEAEAAE